MLTFVKMCWNSVDFWRTFSLMFILLELLSTIRGLYFHA